VVARCDHMQNTLLRSKDYELYIHLQSQHIEPQLYSMKWIRLLLGREFHLEDVLLLWDAMFSDHHETCSKGTKMLAGGRGSGFRV
jgi:TBC1 domain family member 5